MEEIKERLHDLLYVFRQIISDRKENILNLTDEKRDILKQISEVRNRTNEYLDQLEKDFLYEIQERQKENEKTIKDLLEKLIAKESYMSEFSKSITVSKSKFPVHAQKDLAKNMDDIITEETQYLRSLILCKSLDDIKITCQIDCRLQTLTEDIKKFGIVRTVTYPLENSLFRTNDKKLFAPVTNNRKLISLYKIDLNKSTTDVLIRGCVSLQFGDLIFADGKKTRLAVYHNDGSFKLDVPTGLDGMFDIVAINNTMVAATLPYSETVAILDITRRKPMKTIKTRGFCFGIELWKNELIYTVQGKGLHAINLSDDTTNKLYRYNFSSCSYVKAVGENICFTDSDENSVTLLDSSFNIIWSFKDRNILRFPQGLTADVDGNIYITGCFSNNILYISEDGTKVLQVLGADDGLWSPRGIHYNTSRNILLVANENGTVFLFNFNLRV